MSLAGTANTLIYVALIIIVLIVIVVLLKYLFGVFMLAPIGYEQLGLVAKPIVAPLFT